MNRSWQSCPSHYFRCYRIVATPYPTHLWLLKESISSTLSKFQCLYSVFRIHHTQACAILWTSSQSVGFILWFMPAYADESSWFSMLGITIESRQKESLNPSSSTLYKASNSFGRYLAHQHWELSSVNWLDTSVNHREEFFPGSAIGCSRKAREMTWRWFDLTLSNETEQSEFCIPCARCKCLTVPTGTTQTRRWRWQIILIVPNPLQLGKVGASTSKPAVALELRGAF